jgi:hypothetical protein
MICAMENEPDENDEEDHFRPVTTKTVLELRHVHLPA